MKTCTTAELIEKLKFGQQAEMVSPVTDVVVKRQYDGIIVQKDGVSRKNIGLPLPLFRIVMEATWQIERLEITFDSALKYIKEGRTVRCEIDEVNGTTYSNLDDMMFLREAVEGKWYLED